MEPRFLSVHGGHNGNLYDPAIGDGDGNEYLVREWKGGWNEVYRYPDERVANTIAALAIKAANNDNIGYNNDPTLKLTFWQELERSNYDPSLIKTPCSASCSSSTIAIVKATGELLGIEALRQIPYDTWTGGANYASRGFELYTSSDYTASPSKLKPGDLLNNAGTHIVIFVGSGEVSGSAPVGNLNYEIDNITINLDEQEFEFAGTPKTVMYSGSKGAGEWIFDKVSQFVDFIVSIIVRGILMSFLGWFNAVQAIVDVSLKYIEGS